MKRLWLVTPLIFGLVAFVALSEAEEEHTHDHSMESMEHDSHAEHSPDKETPNKARCAYDGMEMKVEAMVEMKYGNETLYFCNEAQMKSFHKSPKKYLKKMMVGDLHILMNTLTMKEYTDMMKSMGMAKMAKKAGANDTHWVNVYLASEETKPLSGIAVKVVAPSGKVSFEELEFDKMMKGFTGTVSILESGKYKLYAFLGLQGVEMP